MKITIKFILIIFNLSIINYLEALKKDFKKSHQINIKILD